MKKIFATMFAVLMFMSTSSALAQTAIPILQATTVQTEIPTTTAKGVVGQAFILDGSRSQDDGVIRSFSWKQVSGPTVRLANTTTWKPSFVPTQAGTYVFELIVVDSTGKSSVARHFEVVVTSSTVAPVVPIAPPVGSTQSGPVFLEIDDVEVESTEAGPALLEIDPPIRGDAAPKKKGNVEYDWKVEEGVPAAVPGVEPDEIDVSLENERATNFGVLLGGGGADEEAETVHVEIQKILMEGMNEAGKPVETVSLNFEKIKVTVLQKVTLFAFIPMKMRTTVEIDGKANVVVNTPWWAFLVKKEKNDTLGEAIVETLSKVIEVKKEEIETAKKDERHRDEIEVAS